VVIRFQPFLFVYGRSDFRFWRAAVYFFDVFPRDELSLFCVFFYVVHGRGKVIRTQRKGLRMSPVFPVVFFMEKNQRQGTGIAAARLIFRPAPHGWSHACGTGKPRPTQPSNRLIVAATIDHHHKRYQNKPNKLYPPLFCITNYRRLQPWIPGISPMSLVPKHLLPNRPWIDEQL
jgi:hypothetical protein